MGELEKAENIYQSLYKIFPKNKDSLHFYGKLLFEKNDSVKGIVLVEQAVKHDPMYANTLNKLGNMYSAKREYFKATMHYKIALNSHPYVL